MLGGLFGALVLTGFIVIARPIILAFSSAELFMLTVLGLGMVGVLSGSSLTKGLLSCALGLLLGMVGAAPATGEWRLVSGVEYLVDGLPLVVVALGLFAIPEIIDLLRRYLGEGTLHLQPLGRGSAWLDTGTHESMLQASQFVQTIEQRQGLRIGCPEEVAWMNGWIDNSQLADLAKRFDKSGYGQYLLGLL